MTVVEGRPRKCSWARVKRHIKMNQAKRRQDTEQRVGVRNGTCVARRWHSSETAHSPGLWNPSYILGDEAGEIEK